VQEISVFPAAGADDDLDIAGVCEHGKLVLWGIRRAACVRAVLSAMSRIARAGDDRGGAAEG